MLSAHEHKENRQKPHEIQDCYLELMLCRQAMIE